MISRSILHRTKRAADRSCRENQNTHFVFSDFFSPRKSCHLRECGKIQYSRIGHRWQIRSMRIACWIPEDTYTHSEYVILIAFPMQQWLCERASVLHRYVYRVLLFCYWRGRCVLQLALSPNATYGHHWARNRQKYIMAIMCRHNMSNTNVSQTKAIYLRREVLCKTWRKYSLWKFQRCLRAEKFLGE
jgi:hypothetical protein